MSSAAAALSLGLESDSIATLSAKLSSFYEDMMGCAPIVTPSSDHPNSDYVADNKNKEYMEERKFGVTQGDFLQMLAADLRMYQGDQASATRRQYVDEKKFLATRTVLEGAAQGKSPNEIVQAATAIDPNCSEACLLRGLFMETNLYDACQSIVRAEIMATQQVMPELFRRAKNHQTFWTTVSLRHMLRSAFATASILNKMGRHSEALVKLERFEMIERKFIDDPFYPQFRALMPELLLRANRLDDCQKFLLSDVCERTFRRFPFVRPYFLWAQAFIDFKKLQNKDTMCSDSFNYILHMVHPATAATPAFYVGRAIVFAYQSCPHIIDYLWGGSEETLKTKGRTFPHSPPSMHPSGAHRELAVDYARNVKDFFKDSGFLVWARRNINTWRAATFIDLPIADRITGERSSQLFQALLSDGFYSGRMGGFGTLLHRAVAAAEPDILAVATLLVLKHPVNPSVPDVPSPLAIAVRRDLPLEFTHLLLLHGADPWAGWSDTPRPNELSAVELACLLGRWRHLKLMFRLCASLRAPNTSRFNQLKHSIEELQWELTSAGNEDSPSFSSLLTNIVRCQAVLDMCRPTDDVVDKTSSKPEKKEQQGAKASASASENKSQKKPEKLCDVCAKPNAINKCSACRQRRYCGQDCQRADWKTHKLVCNK